MKSECQQKQKYDLYDFRGILLERIPNPDLEAVGIRIFRPAPPTKAVDDRPEEHES
jgi:hypothetical protein